MTEKLYYWAEDIDDYNSDNLIEDNQIIEIKRLNFFIGKNNAGKSRLLRSLFITPLKFDEVNFVFPTAFLEKLKIAVQNVHPNNVAFGNSYGGDLNKKFLSLIDDLLNSQENSSIIIYKKNLDKKFVEIRNFHVVNTENTFLPIFNDYDSKLEKFYKKYFFHNKFYIPILRGMRPVSLEQNKQAYYERTHKDYFMSIETNGQYLDNRKFNLSNIITGESLYHELKTHLLGEPEDRD